MASLKVPLVILEVVLAVLLMAGILIQTPKATGIGGTIGGGDGGFAGGYRTRRGLEQQIYWTTWILLGAFILSSLANILIAARG